MNQKERFLNTMHFKAVDRLPYHPSFLGVWKESLKRWHTEGLPSDVNFEELCIMFDTDNFMTPLPVPFGLCPPFEKVMIDEDEATVTYVNHEGIKLREFKVNPELSMPEFLEFPVKDRNDFIKLKPRLMLNEELRFPTDWAEKCKLWKYRKHPLFMKTGRYAGFFGPLRNMMGTENLLYAYYDDPGLIEMMIDNRVELILSILGRIFSDTQFDWFLIWEDMAYNHGPLISPELFKKYMSPAYKKITDYLRSNGVDIIFVDCDGNIDKLIPLWLEAGVNGIYPLEVQSGADVVRYRKEYGNDLLMIGGIDKKCLRYGKKEIDDELSRIAPILEKGGYIPSLDHSLPPDVPYDNCLYYMEQLSMIIRGY